MEKKMETTIMGYIKLYRVPTIEGLDVSEKELLEGGFEHL